MRPKLEKSIKAKWIKEFVKWWKIPSNGFSPRREAIMRIHDMVRLWMSFIRNEVMKVKWESIGCSFSEFDYLIKDLMFCSEWRDFDNENYVAKNPIFHYTLCNGDLKIHQSWVIKTLGPIKVSLSNTKHKFELFNHGKMKNPNDEEIQVMCDGEVDHQHRS